MLCMTEWMLSCQGRIELKGSRHAEHDLRERKATRLFFHDFGFACLCEIGDRVLEFLG